MTILILTQDFLPRVGGITTWVHELAGSLRALGRDVEVVARSFPGEPWEDAALPYRVVRLPGKRWRNRKYSYIYRFLRGVLRERSSTVLICADWKLGVPVMVFNRLHPRRRFRYMIAIHGKDYAEKRRFHRALLKRTLDGSSCVVTGAESVREIILGGEPRCERTIRVIPYGTDVERFRPFPVTDAFRAEHALPRDRRILLSIGRLIERKGFDQTIRALPRVIAEVPEVLYLIGGAGRYERALRDLVDELGLHDHVRFLGFLRDEELPDWYNACEVFVMPSRSIGSDIEGFGIAYLEANACGKPVIAGDSGGVPDAVENGRSGILVDPESVEAISDALLALLTDGERSRRLGADGRDRVLDGFLWKHAARSYAELLDGIGSDERR